MRRLCLVFAWIACLSLVGVPAARAAKSLEIYFIDVEGGQSTLIVDPEGESLLIDTGWDDFNGRDANRIMAAAKDAGIDHIDDLILTHYHSDHAGGVAQLASRIKIDNFFDHGPNTEADTRANYATYEKIAAQGNAYNRETRRRNSAQGNSRAGGGLGRRRHHEAARGRGAAEFVVRVGTETAA